MKPIVRFSLKQTVFLNVVFVILVIIGLFAVFNIPLENMPTVDMGRVFIYTPYFGASAEDVEQLVTIKIEDALDDLEEVEFIQSRSFRNFSSVDVKFNDDVDYKDLYDELRFRTLNIKDELPSGAEEPTFFYLDTHIWLPVVVANVSGNISQESLKFYADELKASLLDIDHVRNVDIEGEFTREFHVSIDPEKLRSYGITFDQVAGALGSANLKIPTGRYRKGSGEYMLDAGKRLSSQADVLDVIVRRDGNENYVRIADLVTSAKMGYQDPIEIPSVNGENTLRLRVIKEDAGDSVTISARVKERAEQFMERHGRDGIHVVLTNDSTFEINDSIKTLGGNLILGMSLVVIILWLTLGFRNAMITAVGIPFTFLVAVAIIYFTGSSLNTISLASFVLVTGILVDDAVIIVENIFRHIQQGAGKREAIVNGTSEVMLPVISSMLTTALAFLPMLIMTGSTGDFFAVIPKTITFALIASLIEALFIVPLHFHDWGPKPKDSSGTDDDNPYAHLESGVFARLWTVYRAVVERLLRHKIAALATAGILFIFSVITLILSITGIAPLIKIQFFPGNYFRYHVTIELPAGTAIEETDRVVRALSRYIVSLGDGQAQSASGTAGFYEDKEYNRFSGGNYGQIVVTLPEEKDRKFPDNPGNDPVFHLEYMKKKIREYAAERFNSGRTPFITVFEESDGPPAGKPVNIRVSAQTMQDAVKAADMLAAYMNGNPEFADLTGLTDDRPDMHRSVRFITRQMAAYEYSLDPARITSLVAGTLNGFHAGEFRAIDEEVDLIVRLARTQDDANPGGAGLSDPMEVLDVPLIEHSAAPVLLRDLVEARYMAEPSKRARYRGLPTITITSDIRAGSRLSSARVQHLISEYAKTAGAVLNGVSLSFGGEFETTRKSYRSLTFAFLIAILLIYMVLSSQFNDYVQPVMILSAVPFAFIGVVTGLFVTRTPFTISSFLAVVGLAGVAVNNSLLLIDFMNVRLRQGKAIRDAVLDACASRMRPVLITTITTILGLLPMAIGIPTKSLSWSSMAMTFVAGIVSSTVLALLIIPVEYELVYKVEKHFREKRVKSPGKSAGSDTDKHI